MINFENKKVLIVDDDKLNLSIAKRFVSSYGIVVNTASGGQELIDKILANNQYDLIITDEMMPEISGTVAMQKLKLLPNFITPIVVLTGDTLDGSKERYLMSGYDYYLAKPINKNELKECLIKFLNNDNK